MTKLLSIVVPAYNVEKYLSTNIDSIIAVPNANKIEIIIVDDGSTDSTPEIADGLEGNHPDIVHVIHKENGGYGSGVNIGIEKASGKYLCVLDADDSLISDQFNKYMSIIENVDADLIINDYRAINPAGKTIKTCRQSPSLPVEKLFDLSDYCRELDPFQFAGIGVHTQVTKTSILKNNLPICHEKHFYTDREYTLYPLKDINSCYYVNLCTRNYLLGRPGQSADRQRQIKLYDQATEVTGYLCDYLKRNQLHLGKERSWLFTRVILHHDRMCYSMQLGNTTVRMKEAKAKMIEHDKWLKANYPEVYHANTYFPVSVLRSTNFALFYPAAKLYQSTVMRNQSYL